MSSPDHHLLSGIREGLNHHHLCLVTDREQLSRTFASVPTWKESKARFRRAQWRNSHHYRNHARGFPVYIVGKHRCA